ncbi:S-layer [Lactobacillus pasteurii DSM 23907 = CRBIP 24.76]|nr:S-layer [Lactobacillus pasteurii DSM 23907 = CRBIP 24.76]
MTAKSTVNGKVATLPVVVTVPNAAVPAEVTTTKNIMHVAKIYDKDGKATSEASLHAYDSVTVVKDPVTINGAKYFKLAGKDQYVKFGNIEGTSRTLSHNSYVYKNTGKATTVKSGKKTVKKLLKKGSSVTTFGSAFNINGHKMYRIGKNQYVKVANF